jgi:hypothetical protein
MQIHYLASYPYELWPLIIELDDGWLVEWWTGECPGEGTA